MDAFQNKFDQAIIVTGDSDLVTPVDMVCHILKKPVIIVNPQKKSPQMRLSYALKKASDSYQYKHFILEHHLQESQMPPSLNDANGRINKPSDW
ncbi:MAG: hypothetical protein RR138_06500 [Akkermansia sp.]